MASDDGAFWCSRVILAKQNENDNDFVINLEAIASLLGLTMEELLGILKTEDPDEDADGKPVMG